MLRLSRFILVLGLIFSAASLSGCYYLRSEPVPEVSNYDLGLPKLRALAASLPGDRPTEVRMALVGTASLPGAMMMAGKSWDAIEMTHLAFQLLRPDGSFVVIDAAQDREAHEASPGSQPFDDAQWADLLRALGEAEQVVITHEHGDHLGGVARYPNPEKLIGRVRLNEAQLANADALDAVEMPDVLREGLEPIVYEDAIAIAPGIVLKSAPGHTPGNQMVFVTLANGREFLFVGDTVWNGDAISELRYRPRFITDWIIGENRETAIHQLRALRDLVDSGEGVHLVIAHDARSHVDPDLKSGFVFVRP